jgi:hypothetical protein
LDMDERRERIFEEEEGIREEKEIVTDINI